jgi:hypothetical protein
MLFFILKPIEKSFSDEKLVASSFSPTRKYQIEIFLIGVSGNILIKETTTSSVLEATIDTYELSNISKDEIIINWSSDTVAEIYIESKTKVRFSFKFEAGNKINPLRKES